MDVRIFPDGGVHSAYLDMVNHPPEGINYVGDYKQASESKYFMNGKGTLIKIADFLNLPYVFRHDGLEFVHSCQKLLWTDNNYVVDIEHGNPFMGAYNINKYEGQTFQNLTRKILSKDNCKFIIPWTKKAEEAFRINFSFLGEKLLDEKLYHIYPTTYSMNIESEKEDIFSFMFVGGSSFYTKGGRLVLEAFDKIKKDYNFKLKIIGDIPRDIWRKYNTISNVQCGLMMFHCMSRDDMLYKMSRCHVNILPSVGDTLSMVCLEAKSLGLPSIMMDSFSAGEIIEDRKTGYMLDYDDNLMPWFNDNGCKIMGKQFHNQFLTYEPSEKSVDQLCEKMIRCMEYKGEISMMSKRCKNEIKNGKFSIEERNKKLSEVYGLL